jgi:hypothetical protein
MCSLIASAAVLGGTSSASAVQLNGMIEELDDDVIGQDLTVASTSIYRE